MNRKDDFLKLAGAAGVAATAAESPIGATGAAPGKNPRQAIVILGESVRYDMLSCNANTGLKTPNLDRIAAQGIRFERAYNCQLTRFVRLPDLQSGPVCIPTPTVFGETACRLATRRTQ